MGRGAGRRGDMYRSVVERWSAPPTRPNDRAPEACLSENLRSPPHLTRVRFGRKLDAACANSRRLNGVRVWDSDRSDRQRAYQRVRIWEREAISQ